jgi:hypothetical protein
MERLLPALIVATIALITVAAIYYLLGVQERWKKTLEAIAGHYGGSYDAGSWFSTASAIGDLDGLQVTVDSYVVSTGKSSTTYSRIRIEVPELSQIELGAESVIGMFSKVVRGSDLQVGDQAFDDAVMIRGPELDLRSRLDAPARAAIRAAVQQGTSLNSGTFSYQRTGYFTDPAEPIRLIESMTEALKALRSGEGTQAERLLQIARQDPSVGVRINAIEALVAHHASHPELPATLHHALDERDPSLVLTAARLLKTRDPSSCLEAMLRLITQHERTPASVQALRLVAQLDPSHAILRERQEELLTALQQDEATALLAAEALGFYAGVEVVQGLMPLTSGLSRSATLKQAAREAIELIQKRSGGERGGLSLAQTAGHDGGLELVNKAQDTGDVSFSFDEDHDEAQRRDEVSRRSREK